MTGPVAFGWFGEPWPSGVCYTDEGRLKDEMRTATPVGEACALCGDPIEHGDRGQAIPHIGAGGNAAVGHVHAECLLCEAIPPGRTYRSEALEVWARLVAPVETTG